MTSLYILIALSILLVACGSASNPSDVSPNSSNWEPRRNVDTDGSRVGSEPSDATSSLPYDLHGRRDMNPSAISEDTTDRIADVDSDEEEIEIAATDAETSSIEAVALTKSDFSDAVDSGTVYDFLAKYDGPICDEQTCLVVTMAPTGTAVSVHGTFNSWGDTGAVKLVELDGAPGIFHGTLPAPNETSLIEYKLKLDGEWALDPTNAYIAFGGYGANSALYGEKRGRITEIADVYSPTLGNSLSLYVYLPAPYFSSLDTSFPVLYMQDGYNIFQNPMAPFGSWDIEQLLDTEIASGTITPCIVVGIDTTDRLSEYTYGKYEVDAPQPKLEQYTTFIKEKVIPLVDDTYRTLEGPQYRAIAGASLGGLSALWIALMEPQFFGATASLSGSFWVGEDGLTDPMRTIITSGQIAASPSTLRIYLDSGSVSGDGQSGYAGDSWVYTDWTRNALIESGWTNRLVWDTDDDLLTVPANLSTDTSVDSVPRFEWQESLTADSLQAQKNLVSLVALGQGHNEAAWKIRFRSVVRYLFAL
ncbi:MAG: alpha/beta hydrolase-fold protein [Myxococcota bacterium]|nr:alpha/beta hydrolase-fold protein [Myxococcota bacterium]